MDPKSSLTPDHLDDPGISVTSLVGAIVNGKDLSDGPAGDRLNRFLGETTPERALVYWLGRSRCAKEELTKQRLSLLLNRDIARLDDMITRQVNAILHHPRFQKLEASWRGLRYLVDQVNDESIKIKMLNVKWKELAQDLDRAIEFDQSQMFHKIYCEEFGTPGGEPFGVLIGDYEIRHRPSARHPIDDIRTLKSVAAVAAAAFAPFVAAAHPALFGLDEFSELELPLNLPRTFEQTEYLKWKSLREEEDSRFVGLTLPRVLMRLPYKDADNKGEGFCFQEDPAGPDFSKYLWGNAAYAFAAVLVRSFTYSRWLADIRGVQLDVEGGGLVTGLPVHSFRTDPAGIAPKCSTDAIITDHLNKELGDLGFIPLSVCQGTPYAAFYSNQSVQKPKTYDRLPATVNAQLSAMLQYILSVSRFAHYLKVIMRDKIGSITGPTECEDFLNRWLLDYTTANEDADGDLKARYPLREASVQVREHPDKPGSYYSVIHLRPHFQLDRLITSVRLATELGPVSMH